MTNQFDFYSIQVSSSRKTDLINAGVPRDKIRSERDGFARYGRRSFPRFTYVASVAFCEATGNPDELAAPWKNRGVSVNVKYFARD
jgi:hypothetical protein